MRKYEVMYIINASVEEEKRAAGVFDDLVRVSVGIEDIEDIISDFTQAITQL